MAERIPWYRLELVISDAAAAAAVSVDPYCRPGPMLR
jgi:hypothetical protein